MVPNVARIGGLVNGEIDGRAVAVRQLLREIPRQL